MKKIFCLLVVFCSFLLCSCDVPQGMRELLAYQGGDFACEAVLSGEKPIALTISRVGDDIIIKPEGTEYIGDAAFVFDEEGAWICSGETRIKLEKTQLQRLCTVYEMFTLDAAKAWRITEEKPGGIEIYKCESDGNTVYIGANTLLPLRFSAGGEELDVKKFEMAE